MCSGDGEGLCVLGKGRGCVYRGGGGGGVVCTGEGEGLCVVVMDSHIQYYSPSAVLCCAGVE